MLMIAKSVEYIWNLKQVYIPHNIAQMYWTTERLLESNFVT